MFDKFDVTASTAGSSRPSIPLRSTTPSTAWGGWGAGASVDSPRVTTCRARGCRAPANRHSCSRVVASVPAAEMQQAGPTALLTLCWDGMAPERACMCQIHLSERGPGPSASDASRPCLALIMISPPLRSNETAINHPPFPPFPPGWEVFASSIGSGPLAHTHLGLGIDESI